MAATILKPIQLAAPSGALTAINTTPAGFMDRIDLRATNILTADGLPSVDLYLVDQVTGANSGYRCKAYPLPYQQSSSALDLEYGLIVPEQMQLQAKASQADAVGLSVSVIRMPLDARYLRPVQLTATTALTTIGGAVPASKVRIVSLRACNIGVADGWLSVSVKDGAVPGNTGYRARNIHVPFNDAASAPDVEYEFPMTAGLELQIRASAADTIAVSLTGTQSDA